MANPLLGAGLKIGAGLLGGFFGNQAIGGMSKELLDAFEFDPQNFSGPGANLMFGPNGGNVQLTPDQAAVRNAFQQQMLAGLGGQGAQFSPAAGLFGIGQAEAPQAFAAQNQALMQGFSPHFGGATLSNLLGTAGGGFQNLAGNIGQFRDLSGQQANLFGQANSLLGQDNLQSIMSARLSNLRAQAEPFETRAFNRLQDMQFATGQRGTTGGGLQTEAFARGLGQADLMRQDTAFNQALGVQGQNRNLAVNLLGQAGGLFGNNIGAMGTTGQLGLGLGELARALQSGGANQALLGRQQNISQGQQRLSNAMGFFGLGQEARQQDLDNALGFFNPTMQQDQLAQSLFLGALNAEAARLGGQGQFAQALGSQSQAQGSMLGGLFGGIGETLGGIFD